MNIVTVIGSKIGMLSKLLESGVIAVLRKVPLEKIEPVAECLIKGGITAIEITVEEPSAFQALERLAIRVGDQAIIGAGTVLDSETAKMAIHRGAEFVFSPTYSPRVVQTVLRYGKIAAPGVMTPTEMLRAYEDGADLVKLFPATGLGVQYIKDVRGPLAHIPILPTGGINLDNVADFIKAGVVGVGIGSHLLSHQAIEKEDYSSIQEKAKQYVTRIRQAREELA